MLTVLCFLCLDRLLLTVKVKFDVQLLSGGLDERLELSHLLDGRVELEPLLILLLCVVVVVGRLLLLSGFRRLTWMRIFRRLAAAVAAAVERGCTLLAGDGGAQLANVRLQVANASLARSAQLLELLAQIVDLAFVDGDLFSTIILFIEI